MRKGSLSWLRTAWLIIISFAINDVKSATSPATTSPTTSPATTSPNDLVTLTGAIRSAPTSGANITAVTALSSTSLQITWEAVPSTNGPITNYTVCYSLNSPVVCSNNNEKTVGKDTLNTSITELNVFRKYYVAVKASTAEGTGPLGGEMEGTTGQAAPSSGATITAVTASSSSSLQITWEAVPNTNGPITGYTVCYSSNSPVVCSNNNQETVGKDTLSTSITGLNVFRKYYVAVKASTVEGAGPLGGEMEGTTGQAAPSSGATITNVTTLSSTSLQVTWEAVPNTNGPITNYTVCYSLNSPVVCSNNNQKTVGNDTLSTSITGLNVFTKYYVAVRASTVEGAGPLAGEMEGTTGQAEPAKGATVTMVIPVSSTALEVTWEQLHENDTNGNITGYRVCYSTQQLSLVSCLEYQDVAGIDTTINLTGLNEATSYFVAVKAGTEAGFGPNGNNLTNATLEAAPAKGATVTMVIPVSSTALEVTWEKLEESDTNGNITGYRVCYATQQLSLVSCLEYQAVAGIKNTTFNLTGLNEATTYFVAVKAGTQVGFGPNGNNLTNTTLEDRPSEGPVITNITPESSTSLIVAWDVLNNDDKNGVITRYRVCYKKLSSSGDICNSQVGETMGNVLRITLNNLEKYTDYVVAVQAGTKIGFGPLGANMTRRTMEDIPGAPRIDTITAGLTTITLAWFPPSELNGVIIKYKVCASLTGQKKCDEPKTIPALGHIIVGLNPGTKYDISLSAFTDAGEGPAQNMPRETDKSALDDVKPDVTSNVAVTDDKTQIGFRLPSINDLSEKTKIQRFNVIVQRWDNNKNKNTLRATPQSSLINFKESDNGMKAYIAITNDNYENNVEIIVGNNSKSNARRKRRNAVEYLNAPLIEDTQYAIFIRVFYNADGTSFQSSDILVKKTSVSTKEEADSEDDKGYLIGIIVMGIIIAILLVLVVYFAYKTRTLKAALNRKGTTGSKGPRNVTMTDSIYEQPDNTTGKTDNENYEEVGDATYTALNRTGKEDEDHFYSHLNEMQENETGV